MGRQGTETIRESIDGINRQDLKAVLIIAAFYAALEFALGITCPVKFLTGISCMGCGMSRAWLSLLKLDLKSALYYHPLFWVPPMAVVLYVFRSRIPGLARKALCILACALFIAVYAYRMAWSDGVVVACHPEEGALWRIGESLIGMLR